MTRHFSYRPTPKLKQGLSAGHPLSKLLQRAVPAASTASHTVMQPEVQALYAEACRKLQSNALHEADALIDLALTSTPHNHYLLQVKAAICTSLHRLQEAESIWQKLLQSRPDDPQLLCNVGLYAFRQKRYELAADLLSRAVVLDPRHASSQLHLGLVHAALHQYERAMACFRQALRVEPRNAEIHFSMGCCLHGQHRLDEAHAAFEQALVLDAGHFGARSNLVFTQHYLPRFDPAANRLQAERVSSILSSSPANLRRPALHPGGLDADRRILRVGLVSPDLNTHPVGFFLEAMLAALPPGEVVLYAYAKTRVYDALSARLRPAFAGWHQVVDWSDEQTMQTVVDDGIDILIDLAGYTRGNSLACFAHRLAPVQMSWLGYFSTTGLATIDYVLADPICVPSGEERYFTERIVRLPHSRYCFSPLKTRLTERSLPSTRQPGVTFGCCQALAKINDRVLGAWALILAAAPDARLRIRSANLDSPVVASALRTRMRRLGLPLERVETLPLLTYDAYLQSHADVDVMLDTFPYPGGTTTAEALYLGVPTLSLALPGMLGRQGEAILKNGGLAHWVCADDAEYVEKAAAIGRRESLWLAEAAELRAQAPANVDSSPLYDAPRFARDWLEALRRTWRERVALLHGQ
ncbi:tetratricopeptide repeat protein [Variovorax sp. RHLX14]|uniref:O-linked N-acetylglucosamine transferase, SPINDLY family protein n=1 Tax=Variovorax sp. RHLX14 TaxID=1259731 RepID=UPI003F47DFD2